MKTATWVRSDKKILGHACQQLSVAPAPGAEPEYRLNLRDGEIYPYNDRGLWGVLVTVPATANRLAQRLGDVRRWRKGDEAVFRVPTANLPLVIQMLGQTDLKML